MKKHFLLLLLLTLLPLAGWAYDYEVDVEVKPYNASVVWSGVKPSGVEASWIGAPGSSLTTTVKTAIAAQLEINNLADYNAGIHDYYLQLKSTAAGFVDNGNTRYNIRLNDANTAQLTITKFTGVPVFDSGSLAFENDDLVYTGEAQALLSSGATATANGFTVPVVYATSATAENWVALADLKETNANTTGYTVYYKVVGTDNYAGSEVQTMVGTKAIAKATITFNLSAAAGLTYNGAPQALLALTDNTKPATNFGANTLQYKIDAADWAELPEAGIAGITGTSAKNGVAYSINLKVPADENGNWDETTITAPIATTIAKATPIFTYVPTHENGGLPSGLVYDTHSHQLVLQEATAIVENTEISVPLKYSIRRYKNVTGTYTSVTVKPFNELVGTVASNNYMIKAYNDETEDLNQVIETFENIVIAKATIPADAYKEPEAKNVRTTGAAQDLVDAATWTGETTYGTFQYSLTNNGTDWSNVVPQGTDVAEYTVYWRILPTVVSDTRNYDIVSGNTTSNITAKSKVTVTTVANQSFGYGTTPTIQKTVEWEEKGSDALNEAGLAWAWYTDEACNTAAVANASGYYEVGDYYVKASGLAVTGATAASQEIVYVPALVKITAGQVNATISGTATYGSMPTFTLTHVSGLSETEAATFNATNNLSKVTIKKDGAVVNELENVAKDNTDLATLAAGEYDLEATASCGDSYTVIVSAGKLTVNPNAEYVFAIADITAVDYKAAKWEPEVTVTGLTAGTDYTVSYGDDTHDNIKAGEGIVKIAGAGNYAGATGSKTFTINKANLTITADNFTGENAWTYGTDEPTYTATVTGYLDGESFGGTLDGIEGTLKVKRTSNETVGMHTGALVADFYDADDNKIAAPVATNYNLAFNPGDLQVAKGAVVIQLKEAVTATYGDDPATSINAAIKDIAKYEYVSGLSELEAANFASIINVGAATHVLVAATKYEVGTDYTFTIDGATSTNYNVEIKPGKYTVTQRAIEITANDQIISQGASLDQNAYTLSSALAYTDDDLGVTLSTDKTAVGGPYADAITVEATNPNYNFSYVRGALTINGAATITLTRVAKDNFDNATVAQLIKDYDGQENVDVTIKFNDPGYNTLKPNKWYAFILPFKTDVKMISDAFGYAIVDLLNEGNTNSHRTVFSLKMDNAEIPANTPFIVKVWKSIDMENDGVTFDDVKIDAPATYDEIAVSDAAGNQFIGSYTGINGLGAYKPEYSGHVLWWSLSQASENDNDARPASDTGYLRQMSAFSYVPDDVAAHEFIIEELGGNTTVIRGINIDGQNISAEGLYNMNGMKLNSVPTQKGVYIQNGKKVVIK